MNSASYQTPESKKQEFRKYLEKSGVIDALTKGMIMAFGFGYTFYSTKSTLS